MAITRYGKNFPDGVSDLDIELWCYAHDDRAEGERGRLTRFDHFKNAVDLLWNTETSSRKVVWNEWTERMLRAMIDNKFVGLAGAGSSGKSDSAACFIIVDYLSAPTERMWLVCSTTLAGARGRIWKSVTELWNALQAKWDLEGVQGIGKMVQSKGRIMGLDVHGNFTESTGIWLIAAGKDDEGEADKKLKGLKAPTNGRLGLVADEFSDLGMCVFTAMVGNMSSTPGFKGIGMANPGSKLTPFGRFVEPKAGWNSLSVGMEFWETRFGVCLSFDAHTSPRMLTPEFELPDGSHAKFSWMPSKQSIAQAALAFGEDSMEYWAQIRGMFCPTGSERTVWSELELLDAVKSVEKTEWDSPPTKMCAALDPAFVTGGDRSPMMWAEFGTIKGVKTMNFLGYRVVAESAAKVENDDGEEIQISISENVINQFKEHCQFYQIPAHCAGFDATGGGVVFGQWLHTKWSHAVHGIRFGEKPVDRRADSTNSSLIYKNRVTQLWVQPKALVRQGQIRGVPMDVVTELCQRKWHVKNHTGSVTCVEEKPDMKKRLGKSPDLADTFCILIEVAILNGFLDINEIRKDDRRVQREWKNKITNLFGGGQTKSLVMSPSVKTIKYKQRTR
jgi:hypothetical protein